MFSGHSQTTTQSPGGSKTDPKNKQDEIRGAMIHVLSEGQFGMPSVDGESFYSSISSASGASSGGDASGGSGSGSADGDSGSGLKLIRLEEVSNAWENAGSFCM